MIDYTLFNRSIEKLDLSKTYNEFYISDKNYKYEMVHKVRPFLERYLKKDYFYTRDNLKIYYERYIKPNAKRAVVICHGMGECTTKLEEVVYYFFKAGYSVFIMDDRGHGNSDREIDDLTIIHVDGFEKYIIDLREFLVKVVYKYNRKCYLYGHSMGGGIGARFIEEYPECFEKVILTAPMIEMNTFVPKGFLKFIIDIGFVNGKNSASVFPHYTFKSIEDFQMLCSTAKVRADYYYEKVLMNPRLNTYGLSFSWLKSSLKGTLNIQKRKNMKKVKSKLLVFQAEDDYLVKGCAMRKFVKNIKGARLIFVPNVKHELYNTYNDVLIPYFNTIFEFLKED